MASQKTKFTVGLFVACGLCIAVLAIVWLGMSRYFEKGKYYVTYFNESVQGLTKDSPVKYRGVSIGRVESIGVAPDSKLIQAVLKIETDMALTKDMVAQLKTVGITGSMFIGLDRKKEGEPDLSPHLSFPSEYPIVASKPSEISKLLQGLDDVMKQIKAMDLEGISDKIKLTLANANQVMADANVEGISRNITSVLTAVRRILDPKKWDGIVASLEKSSRSLTVVMDKAKIGLDRINQAVGRADNMLVRNREAIQGAIVDFKKAIEKSHLLLEKGTSLVQGTNDSLMDLARHLLVVTQNLERASDNLNRLVELVADQPSQLLFGEPPPPRALEPKVPKR